ncbi:MAG: hypothetical protein LBR31_06235 [Desulfovibrio sp.]|nr:hypothetical protein [Desulfovibrio sp.]
MPESSSLLFVTNAEGRPVAVQIPFALWKRLEAEAGHLLPDARPGFGKNGRVEEPLKAFDEFLRYWDFRYPYNPAVSCPHCGVSVTDWREGEGRPFRLTNASLGGLLVFRCLKCNTTIRQKHFKDHVAYEFTPPHKRQS